MRKQFIKKEIQNIYSHKSGKCKFKSSNTNYPFIKLAESIRKLQIWIGGKRKQSIFSVLCKLVQLLSRITWQNTVTVQMCAKTRCLPYRSSHKSAQRGGGASGWVHCQVSALGLGPVPRVPELSRIVFPAGWGACFSLSHSSRLFSLPHCVSLSSKVIKS